VAKKFSTKFQVSSGLPPVLISNPTLAPSGNIRKSDQFVQQICPISQFRGGLMRLPEIDRKQGFRLVAFGFELHLWMDRDAESSAIIQDGDHRFSTRFKEDNLTLAKFHLLAVARNRAIYRWRDQQFPAEETLVDSWQPRTFVDES
jgi:hypothetical protein